MRVFSYNEVSYTFYQISLHICETGLKKYTHIEYTQEILMKPLPFDIVTATLSVCLFSEPKHLASDLFLWKNLFFSHFFVTKFYFGNLLSSRLLFLQDFFELGHFVIFVQLSVFHPTLYLETLVYLRRAFFIQFIPSLTSPPFHCMFITSPFVHGYPLPKSSFGEF